MEGSESEALFESLNLNPRSLVNEILNTVENLFDDAFDFYHQEASTVLDASGTDRSQHLSQGIDQIRSVIQSNVGRRLGMWQEYCLRHCFAVPQGFSLPKNESLDESLPCQDVLCDPDLDTQLDSLRERLTLIGKESAELNRELQVLERQSASSSSCAALVNEVLQLYEQNSGHDMLEGVYWLLLHLSWNPLKDKISNNYFCASIHSQQLLDIEMVRTASELHAKVEKLRTRRIEKTENITIKGICDQGRDFLTLNRGLCNAKLEDLQVFLADLKKM